MIEFTLYHLNNHESRHSSYHADDELQNPSEDTPLLRRFPRVNDTTNVITALIVSMMILVLLSGFAIGVYLLVLQSDADNMLPPIEMPLFVARSQWDESSPTPSEEPITFKAKSVVIEQTDTGQCQGKNACIQLMKSMQANMDDNKTLPYNFAISTDGFIYECLGWEQPSPLYPELYGLVIAFIGNYTVVKPSSSQLESAYNLITVSLANSYLERDFIFTSKNDTTLVVSYLKKALTDLSRSKLQRRSLLMPKIYMFKSAKYNFN
ncbi:peptidoglycan-recognition protein SA-like isoform X1 [Vanessa cardui]|uniref:peptidoglycan-recognition protein SA-like isoform X1 n=1 Tax=Vanessa cardui TaxID=171605 RepID=UPI001F12A7D3|nr:peptidoglycan-recognition protein SA-like isoform X1 [Vanessa cardui]